jgi:hypothetical protein
MPSNFSQLRLSAPPTKLLDHFTDTDTDTVTDTNSPYWISIDSPRSPIVTNSYTIRATDIPIDSARTRELDRHILMTSIPFHTLTSLLEVGSGTLTVCTGIALRPKRTLNEGADPTTDLTRSSPSSPELLLHAAGPNSDGVLFSETAGISGGESGSDPNLAGVDRHGPDAN